MGYREDAYHVSVRLGGGHKLEGGGVEAVRGIVELCDPRLELNSVSHFMLSKERERHLHDSTQSPIHTLDKKG
jgi:hypothetical protein